MNTDSVVIGTVAGAANFSWDDDHNGHARVPVTVGTGDRTGIVQVSAACTRGGNDNVQIRFGLGNRLALLPVGSRLWARGQLAGDPFQLQATEVRRQRREVPWTGRLQLVGTVMRSAPDGRVTLELSDGSTMRAMLPLDTAISIGERIAARVLPAPRGLVPRLRDIAFAGEER